MPDTPALPAAARRLIGGVTVSSLGTGLTLPFTFVLLSDVRGFPLTTTGLLLAAPGVVGLAAVPVSGVLIDRLGPAVVLRLCLVLQAVGSLLLGAARTPVAALVALLLVGLGIGPSFPASSSLMGGLVTSAGQARAFGLQFTMLNASIGVGGLVGAAVVDVHRPATFAVLYLANAVLCLCFAAVVPPGAPALRAAGSDAPPSYAEVLRDPVFRRVFLLALLLALSGYAALDGGLPAYSRVVGHVSPSALGLLFAVNTAVIVAGQLAVLRLIGGWRRTSAIAIAGAVWALSWAVLLALPALHGTAATALVLAFGGAFGWGETFFAPALQPLVNALATDRLRGRYNAVSQSAFSVAFVVSPALAAGLIAAGLGVVWLTLLVAGSAGAAVVAVRLRPRLTDRQDGLHRGEVLPEEALGTRAAPGT